MAFPAARLTDMTVHGGVITMPGCPTVIIGGLPAARMTDMHTCPMITGVVPHVGGPIIKGSATVFIGGLMAARMLDPATCVGPPDMVIKGCPTVLIGDAAGGGGGGGGSAGAGAAASAGMAASGEGGSGEEGPHWIRYHFVDSAGNSLSNIYCNFTAPDSEESVRVLGSSGIIRWSGQEAGQANVIPISLSNAQWSGDTAEVEEAVTMTADVVGYDPGTEATFSVYKRDLRGADELVTTIQAQTEASTVQAEWQYEYPEETEGTEDDQTGMGRPTGYSNPDYYFIVRVEGRQARSGFLVINDTLEIELKDPDEEPVPDEEYILYLPSGEIRTGTLDGNGTAQEENIPPGYCEIRFPNLPDNM